MKYLLSSLIILIVTVSCSRKTEESYLKLTPQKSIAVDSICQAFINNGKTIGLSVAISKDGQIVYSEGFGLANIESNTTVTDESIFPIASVSKLITSILTLKLIENGNLNLQDKVTDLFQDFPRQQYMDEITIEHLLRHQSGLPDHEDWFDSIYINHKRVFTRPEFFVFLNQPLFYRPGTMHLYSNSGYSVLSEVLEEVTGLPFNELIKKHISVPADAGSIGLWPLQWGLPYASMGYEITDDGIDTSFHMMTKAMKGDGGLSASPRDLVKLIDAVVEGKILSQKSMELLLDKTTLGNLKLDYGLGTRGGYIRGYRTWGHSGGYKGIGWSNVTHYPEVGYTFSATQNTSYSPDDIWLLRHKVMEVVLELEKPEFKIKNIENKNIYEGTYASKNRWGSGPQSIRKVTFNRDTMIWDNPDTPTPGFRMYEIGEHTFAHESFPYDEYKFHVHEGEAVAVSEFLDGTFVSVKMKMK